MDRRKFLSSLIGGVAAAAAVRTFPFRVFSFPSEITSVNVYDLIGTPEAAALACEKVQPLISELMQRDHILFKQFKGAVPFRIGDKMELVRDDGFAHGVMRVAAIDIKGKTITFESVPETVRKGDQLRVLVS